jgi:DNA-binding response OmpR family regulator
MKSILIVDDDRDLQNLLRLNLERVGYQVVSAFSGEQALEIVENRGMPHLAIVDIYMPGMTGPEFCGKIQGFSDVPVIMLTSEVDTDIVVDSIERYAEDYMTKPFVIREFLVRVERLMRRIHSFDYSMVPCIHVDDHLQVSLGCKAATVDGMVVSLTPTETKLLHIFLNNRNRIVTLEFLLNRLWPREEVYEDRLRVHIHRLRRKIENASKERTYIVTERGLGYRFSLGNRPESGGSR